MSPRGRRQPRSQRGPLRDALAREDPNRSSEAGCPLHCRHPRCRGRTRRLRRRFGLTQPRGRRRRAAARVGKPTRARGPHTTTTSRTAARRRSQRSIPHTVAARRSGPSPSRGPAPSGSSPPRRSSAMRNGLSAGPQLERLRARPHDRQAQVAARVQPAERRTERVLAFGYGRLYGATAKKLFALDPQTGNQLWSSPTHLPRNANEGIDMTPQLYDGTVLISTIPGNTKSFYKGNGDGIVWAFDAVTGKTKWKFNTVGDGAKLWGNRKVNSGAAVRRPAGGHEAPVRRPGGTPQVASRVRGDKARVIMNSSAARPRTSHDARPRADRLRRAGRSRDACLSQPALVARRDEVVVALEAAPVHPSDIHLIRAFYGVRPHLPAPLGAEGVGKVAAVGTVPTRRSSGTASRSCRRMSRGRGLTMSWLPLEISWRSATTATRGSCR